MLKIYRKKKAFTLIELLIVCTIIAVLAIVAIVSYNSARAKSRDSKRISDSQTIGAALEQYYESNGNYLNATKTTTGTANCGASKPAGGNYCNSYQSLSGGQWIFDKNTATPKSLIDFLTVVPVDPLNAAPTDSDIDSNAYYYTSSADGQTYYLAMTLEDSGNSFVTGNLGVAGNGGAAPGTATTTTTCLNGYNYYKFSGTGVVTLGRNRSDSRTSCP